MIAVLKKTQFFKPLVTGNCRFKFYQIESDVSNVRKRVRKCETVESLYCVM